MSGSENKIDPVLLQARWVLGGLTAEELSVQAVSALEQGLGGTALGELAGMVRPTLRDLENLPERAFAEMGIGPIDKDQAISLLITRGEPPTSDTLFALLEAFPEFSERWRKHIAWWGGQAAGSYNDMAEFVLFVIEDLDEKGNIEETRRVFLVLERLFVQGDQEVRDLIALGFFETLQCVASWRPYGNKVFEQFMAPTSLQVWREIQQMWAGKNSLADVIRAERQRR